MIPEGSPGGVRAGAAELSGLSRDLEEMRGQLQALLRGQVEGADAWQGAAAQAFAGSVQKRLQALELGSQALAAGAVALEEYAARLEQAQEGSRQAQARARGAGLALAGDGVDAASLLPPDPGKLLVAAEVTQQLAEAQAAGLRASAQLASALRQPEQLARRAEWLLGDRSGLTPGGFLHDLIRAPARYLWDMGVGTDALVGALLMAGLGDGSALGEVGEEGKAALGFAKDHPGQALQTLLGADEIQAAFEEDHPGEAIGLLGTSLVMTLNPEGEDAQIVKALEREDRLTGGDRAAQGPAVQMTELPKGTRLTRLPYVEKARVDAGKFSDYSMDPEHPQNEGKWQAFDQLGYDVNTAAGRSNAAQQVSEQVQAQLGDSPAVLDRQTKYGPRWRVETEIVGPNGRHATVVTVWQYDEAGDVPRLITNWARVHK